MLNSHNFLSIDHNQDNYLLVSDSIPWFLISLHKKHKKILHICENNDEIFSLYNKLKILSPDKNIFLFPSWDAPLFLIFHLL